MEEKKWRDVFLVLDVGIFANNVVMFFLSFFKF